MSSNSLLRFPRLRDLDADDLANRWLARPGSLEVSFHHPDQVFAPIGGHKVTQGHLEQVRDAVHGAVASAREVNDSHPQGSSGITWETRFDVHVGVALHQTLGISRSEAAVPGVWSWLTLVLLPDVIAFRHPRTKKAARLTGGPRNILSVTWWPVEVLGRSLVDPTSTQSLQVDEIVGLFERSALSRNNELAVAYATLVQQRQPQGRMSTTREFAKLVRRMGAHTSWSVARTEALESLLEEAAGLAASSQNEHDILSVTEKQAPIRLEVRLGALSLPVEIERDVNSPIQPCGNLGWTAIKCPSTTDAPTAIFVEGQLMLLKSDGLTKRGFSRFRCEQTLTNGVTVNATIIRRRGDVYLECRIG